MRKIVLATVFVVLFLAANLAFGQNPDFEAGPVWRMVYYRILPGQEAVFWKDLRDHAIPLMELAKEEGVQVDFKIFRNPLKDHPGDWDALLMLGYPNYAALDLLEAKAGTWYLKHFGSNDKIAESVKRRNDSREVIAIRLVREVN